MDITTSMFNVNMPSNKIKLNQIIYAIIVSNVMLDKR